MYWDLKWPSKNATKDIISNSEPHCIDVTLSSMYMYNLDELGPSHDTSLKDHNLISIKGHIEILLRIYEQTSIQLN